MTKHDPALSCLRFPAIAHATAAAGAAAPTRTPRAAKSAGPLQ